MPYLTNHGTSLALGKMLSEDDEAAVFEVVGNANHVAKRYPRPLLPKQARKLEEMLKLATPELLACTAWPLATLRIRREDPLCGILMRKVADAKRLSELQSPAHRRFAFATVDWRLLIRAARHCALAVNEVHRVGARVGDLNSNRLFVNQEGFIHILGCDSFQIELGDDVYFGRLGMPEYLPPELQMSTSESFVYTANHDAFSLAVIIFRLLLMGKHPFVGYRGPNDMPVGQAIQEHRFAYGSTATSLLMVPPPGPTLSDLPGAVANMFQRAFARGSEREGARPTPAEWTKALDDLAHQTTVCTANPGHYYFSGLTQCPWCRIEREGGSKYFVTATMQATQSTSPVLGTQRLVEEFEAIASPATCFTELKSAPLLPPAPTTVSAGTRNFQQVVNGLGVLTIGSALSLLLGFLSRNFLYISATITGCLAVGWLLAHFGSPLVRLRRQQRKILAERRAELAQVEKEMAAVLSRLNADWLPRYKAAAEIRDQLQTVDTQEANDMRLLQATLRERQLHDFLSRHFLRGAKIDQVTESVMTVLESFDVETVADITVRSLAAVPGLDETLTATLLAWRRTTESGFSFDSRRGLPPAEVALVRNKYHQTRQNLHEELEVHCEALAQLSANARVQAGHFTVPLASSQSAVVQATEDLKACR